tara:strand:- start:212 stop:514 length:303 start_codon:yes stop_codon:yes gene_type:complete
MSESNYLPSGLSHKQLKNLLKNAPKDCFLETNGAEDMIEGKNELNEILIKWSHTSEELLNLLNRKDSHSMRNRDQKSLIALGALKSYLSLAMQANKEAFE